MAADLRIAFDRSFALPPPPQGAPEDDFIAIRLAGNAYALRLPEIAALLCDKKIAPLPIASPALRGLVGYGGMLLPAYDLQMLLGYPPADAPRWLAVAAGWKIAFALPLFESYRRIRRDTVLTPAAGHQPFLQAVIEGADERRPVLHIPSLIAPLLGHMDPERISHV